MRALELRHDGFLNAVARVDPCGWPVEQHGAGPLSDIREMFVE